MRWIGMLAWLAACSYAPERLSLGDDSPDDAPSSDGPPIDAPVGPDSPAPMFVPIETITVSANGTPIDSTTPLTNGVTYRLRASGTWFIDNNPPTQADAEYYGFPSATIDGTATFDVGLGIDDLIVDLNKQPDWGAFRQDHIYEIEWIGDGTPITAKIHDQIYSNNSGSLTLVILELQ